MQVVVIAAFEPRGHRFERWPLRIARVWEKPPANNLPQTPHSAGAYGTGYVFFLKSYSVGDGAVE